MSRSSKIWKLLSTTLRCTADSRATGENEHQVPGFDQPVYLVEKGRHPLNFVNQDRLTTVGGDSLGQALRVGQQFHADSSFQEIKIYGVRQTTAKPEGLAGTPWAE